MKTTAITPTRNDNYPEWYQQVIQAADLAENAPVRGCMIIKPWGYAIWENMQKALDERFKATGHVNAYFPLLIPLSFLEKEAAHVDGFAKECAVVTHHRLKGDGQGKLIPEGELEEPYVIRPTSETMIGSVYAKWIQSYRDLPILINQWANIVRWEMRTRLFLRTSEFLWQEGHTAHATAAEAISETAQMLDIYADFAENWMAMPVIKGEKTAAERFPGAVATYAIEALMQDGKALQAGTSHFLGQNFSKAFGMQFLDQQGEMQHAWTTSWGVSTRLIGGLIMSHSDDNGLVLPPALALYQIVIMPIYKTDSDREAVLAFCQKLKAELCQQQFYQQALRVHIDDRDIRGGEKAWQWIKKGVPIRLEIGPRDIANDNVMLATRLPDPQAKTSVAVATCLETMVTLLNTLQQNLLQSAKERLTARTVTINNLDEFNTYFSDKNPTPGFASCYALDDPKIESFLKPLKVTARCIPLDQTEKEGQCIFTGEKVLKKTLFAKAY